MKLRLVLPTLFSFVTCAGAWAQSTPDDLRNVAPALERYSRERLAGEVWKRPELSPRDRALPPSWTLGEANAAPDQWMFA